MSVTMENIKIKMYTSIILLVIILDGVKLPSCGKKDQL
jgi:hypothetical protein